MMFFFFLWILPKKISFGRKVKGNLSQMKNGSYTYRCVELKCMLYEHGEIVLWPFISTPPRTPHCILSKENIISFFFRGDVVMGALQKPSYPISLED